MKSTTEKEVRTVAVSARSASQAAQRMDDGIDALRKKYAFVEPMGEMCIDTSYIPSLGPVVLMARQFVISNESNE